MSNVRAVMINTGEVVIGAQVGDIREDGSIELRYPVTLHQVTQPDGQQGMTFAPFFPMADYGTEVTLPGSMINMIEDAQGSLAQSHSQYVAQQSGLVIANAMPQSPGDTVDPSEMTDGSGLRLQS